MNTKMHYIEIGGVKYLVDPGKVTIEDWMEMTQLIKLNKKDDAGAKLLEIVMSALGPGAHSLSIVYLPLLIPRVLEVLTGSITLTDVDTEIEEILKRKPPTNS